eukprot:1182336-Prymnesium_polylepis.1
MGRVHAVHGRWRPRRTHSDDPTEAHVDPRSHRSPRWPLHPRNRGVGVGDTRRRGRRAVRRGVAQWCARAEREAGGARVRVRALTAVACA